MASRKVAEERSVGETLLKEFVLEDVSSTSDSMTSSFHLLRLLNEVQDDLARHGSASYSAAVAGRDSAERMGAVLAVSAAIAEARVRVADACYSELDVSVNALDRRLKLMDAILKLHGQGMGGEVTKEEKLEVLTRPVDSISSRVRRPREGGGGGGGGGGGDGPPSLMVQLAAATGGGGALGKAASSPGALDVAIGTYEPRYCTCNQVAFGEMVACDSESCSIEWFHMACVGLSAATRPKGKWLCSGCRQQQQQQQQQQQLGQSVNK